MPHQPRVPQPERTEPDCTPPIPRRVLGVPEFAKIPDHTWISRGFDTLLIALFMAAIVLPALAFGLHWQSGESLDEKRELNKPPRFGHDAIDQLPGKIDAYYGDYFGFRKQLIHWQSVLQRKWLGVSTDNVVIGKNGWLFYSDEGTVLDDFLGRSRYTTESPLGQSASFKVISLFHYKNHLSIII